MEPSSYIVAINGYVYVHCSAPDAGSYAMQCPGSTVWNPRVNGCVDFGGGSSSPPRLVGPLGPGSSSPPRGGRASFVERRPASNPSSDTPVSDRHQHKYIARLPHSPRAPAVTKPPRSNAGGQAPRLTLNPCVVDNRGTLSLLRFHPYPNDPSKYLECVPAERFVIIICFRSCNLLC